jgi:parallel beta-helix repeat protein
MVMQISSDSQPKQASPYGDPVAMSKEKALPPHKEKKVGPPLPIKSILIAVVIVAVIAAAAGAYAFIPRGAAVTTVSTSTIGQHTQSTTSALVTSALSGCTNITSAGNYNVNFKIKTSLARGACINIMANNVRISCGGNKIVGSGPFDALPPFTYGIEVSKASNVTINDCQVANFSYGVAAFSSSKLTVLGSNVSSNYMSDVYLNSTTNSTIQNNRLTSALSWQGALFLSNGSVSTLVENNTVAYNQVYGVNVSANNENFLNNNVNGSSQYGFYCSPPNSYPISSTAKGNVCTNNNGCSFLSCQGSNLPANISKVILTNGVFGCGSINSPGSYTLEGNINMGVYLNISNPESSSQQLPCIAITADNVNLNCNGHQIYNGTYPIGVYGASGVSVSNCRIQGAKGYGIVMLSTSNSTIFNTSVSDARLGGILIDNSNFDNVTNSSFTGGKFGVSINNSQSDNLLGVNSSKNTYGLFLSGSSIGNNFYKVTALNNSAIDVYAGINLTGSQTEFVSGMSCYNTNAHWAPCKTFVVANLGYTPVTACIAISSPGTYIVQSDILSGTDSCISIKSNNVVFNCADKFIQGSRQASNGFAIVVNGSSNVLIANCTVMNFQGGVSAYKTKNLNISNIDVWNSAFGFLVNSSVNSNIENNYINTTTKYGMNFIAVNSSTIRQNTVWYGGVGSGIILNNSRINNVVNNTVSGYQYGFVLIGTATNNTFSNNTASVSSTADFFCSPSTGDLNAEIGGIDYGATEIGCNWMALIQKLSPTPECTATVSPDTFVFSSDYIYPFGSTCYTILSNDSTINCNGHTVVATNGGVFARVEAGTHGSLIENCYLKGFTTAIEAENGSATIFNNTILNTGNSTGISVNDFSQGTINQNNVTGGGRAFEVLNSFADIVNNNFVYAAKQGYYVYNSITIRMTGDNAAKTTSFGLVLNATSQGQFQSLNMSAGSVGLECIGSSRNSSALLDLGGNRCSSVRNCTWLKTSAQTC